jgi:predicted HTH domain antitoxin
MSKVVRIIMEIPDGALGALRLDPDRFSIEVRLAAAVKWYELQLVSQSLAAEIAGLSRAEFIVALARFTASPFQERFNELAAEARGS